MKTLFKKDLRENFRLALIALPMFILLLVINFHTCASTLKRVVNGESVGDDSIYPLLSNSFLISATFFCAIFGAVLGWLQTRNEAHRDLWAFLIHRPITRTQIFQGKTAAGLCLYTLGAGLPLLGMVLYVSMPGAVAAPFEPAMALPALAIFLTGIAYYFAGMLTGLRQASWFGSRIFGLGGAILASAAVNAFSEFWEAALATILIIAMLAVAAWGAYQSGGFYRGQPVFGRITLALSLACGSFVVLGLIAGIGEMVSQENNYNFKDYSMGLNGRIYVRMLHNGVPSFSDLEGKPIIDPATGHEIARNKFYSLVASSISANAAFGRNGWWWNEYTNAKKFFTLWSVSEKNAWYVDRHGRLLGFNGITRRSIGALTAPDNNPFITSFFGNNYFNSYNMPHILATKSAVYRVDLVDRKLSPMADTTPDDPILSFGEENYNTNVLVLTHRYIRFLWHSGSVAFQLPYQPDDAVYPEIQVNHIDNATNKFAVWFHPDGEHQDKPIVVLWLSKTGEVTHTFNLPVEQPENNETSFEKAVAFFTPPTLQLVFELRRMALAHWYCLISSAFCVVIAWRLLRRYRFTAFPAISWLLFIFLFGIPALMAFLFAQEWPKSETCPNCGQPRTVDHEHCEHCAAPFSPPDKTGIEIFEPLTAP